ncbi:monocarboxylate transporter 2-like [Patiria miniata]|uniref:Major facilitator superfamily (MFS) profile domain-containing protein n=1 Tax=Patiria miniata TaxID=46514 RepID=A0A913ZPS6_PATMI|nr:monocarboxylate transporter 2-like [Patiria miniata]
MARSGSVSSGPDAGWAWAVLGACHLAFFLWEGLCKGLGVLLPTLTEQFNTETWPVGWAIGLMLAARGLSGLLLSSLEHRWQHRPVAVVCGVLASLGVLAACVTNNVVQFGLCIVLLTGAACGILLNCCLVLLGVYFDRYYAMANGIACAGTSIGILIFAPVTQFLLDVYGWRGCLLLIGGMLLHLIVVGSLFRPLSNRLNEQNHQSAFGHDHSYKQIDHDVSDDDETQGVSRGNVDTVDQGAVCGGDIDSRDRAGRGQATDLVSRFIQATNLDLFWSLSYLVLLACVCNLCVVIVAWVVFTVPNCIVKGLPTKQASAVAVAGGLGILTGQLGHGPLVDREILGARSMMYLAHFLMGLAFLVDPLLDWLWPLVAGNFIFGVGFGIALPLSFTMIRNLVGGARMSSAVGWAEAAGGITRIVASFLTGWLYDRTGSYDLSFLIIGSIPCLVLLLFLLEDVLLIYRSRKERK